MAMDVRHFKRSGGVTLTAYATIEAAQTAVVNAGTGAHINMFPDRSGFVYSDMGRGWCDLYLVGTEGTTVAPIYRIRLLPDIP